MLSRAGGPQALQDGTEVRRLGPLPVWLKRGRVWTSSGAPQTNIASIDSNHSRARLVRLILGIPSRMLSLDGSLRSIILLNAFVWILSLRFGTSLFKLLHLTLRAFVGIALSKCTRDQHQHRDCGDDQQAHGWILLLA